MASKSGTPSAVSPSGGASRVPKVTCCVCQEKHTARQANSSSSCVSIGGAVAIETICCSYGHHACRRCIIEFCRSKLDELRLEAAAAASAPAASAPAAKADGIDGDGELSKVIANSSSATQTESSSSAPAPAAAAAAVLQAQHAPSVACPGSAEDASGSNCCASEPFDLELLAIALGLIDAKLKPSQPLPLVTPDFKTPQQGMMASLAFAGKRALALNNSNSSSGSGSGRASAGMSPSLAQSDYCATQSTGGFEEKPELSERDVTLSLAAALLMPHDTDRANGSNALASDTSARNRQQQLAASVVAVTQEAAAHVSSAGPLLAALESLGPALGRSGLNWMSLWKEMPQPLRSRLLLGGNKQLARTKEAIADGQKGKAPLIEQWVASQQKPPSLSASPARYTSAAAFSNDDFPPPVKVAPSSAFEAASAFPVGSVAATATASSSSAPAASTGSQPAAAVSQSESMADGASDDDEDEDDDEYVYDHEEYDGDDGANVDDG